MTGSKFLFDPEWIDLVNDAIRALWGDVTAVNKDFRVSVLPFSITATATNLVALPPDFREVRFVRRNPGTASEIYLNKLGARAGSQQAEVSYRLEGGSLYIEPRTNSIAPYDLRYVPQPPVFAGFTVRALGGSALPACTLAGAGVGKTITAQANGVLPAQDGIVLAAGDRFAVVVTNVGADLGSSDFGVYVVTSVGTAGSHWILTRSTDFDQALPTEAVQGAIVTPTEGTLNANVPWVLSTFAGAVDVGAQTWNVATLDAELDPHQEYLVIHAAIKALAKEESTEQATTLMQLMNGPDGQSGIRGEVRRWASDQRSADPDQVEDVRGSRRRRGLWSMD